MHPILSMNLALAAALLGACAAVAPPQPVAIPPALDAGAGQAHTMTIAARGVQVYECRVPAAGGAAAWTFVAPEADLFDAQGRPFGRHGAGPFWQAPDGSRIVGTVKARADAPEAGAIPWLLLSARSTGGDGVFARVTAVQRVRTAGGVAPQGACDTATAPLRVAYTADYRLFVAN